MAVLYEIFFVLMYLTADFDGILLAFGSFHLQSLSSFWKAFCQYLTAWTLNNN